MTTLLLTAGLLFINHEPFLYDIDTPIDEFPLFLPILSMPTDYD